MFNHTQIQFITFTKYENSPLQDIGLLSDTIMRPVMVCPEKNTADGLSKSITMDLVMVFSAEIYVKD